MVSKFTPRNSPSALRSHSQRQVALSPPGAAPRLRRGLHAPDQKTGHRVALDAVQAEVREDLVDPQLVHGGETGGFDASGAGTGELQGDDVDLGVKRDL